MPKKFIIPQMFDVRPVDKSGNLDWKKINKVGASARLEAAPIPQRPSPWQNDYGSKNKVPETLFSSASQELGNADSYNLYEQAQYDYFSQYNSQYQYRDSVSIKSEEKAGRFASLKKTLAEKMSVRRWIIRLDRGVLTFAFSAALVLILTGSIFFLARGFKLKEKILGDSTEGYENLEQAMKNMKNFNFSASSLDFQSAYQNFSQAADNMEKAGSDLADLVSFLPPAGKISSGKNAIEAGKHFALAGQALNDAAAGLMEAKDSALKNKKVLPLVAIFRQTEKKLKIAVEELEAASQNLDKINPADIPEAQRQKFTAARDKLPPAVKIARGFLSNSHIFTDLLGGEGPRKYLFLFQNNHEMRATGGFIGSYALLDINEGRVRKFFIDEIFNPDGQLKEKIVPPEPIQKISVAWSLHDSNWWPDFPVSARKAISFYEKTGGPTVDGVVAVTPVVMQRLLQITGDIEMKDYNVTLNSENFMAEVQREVEVDYDKEENRPKKILADLAPIVLDKIFNSADYESLNKIIDVLSQGLNEKHILLYSENEELQKIISAQGWAGEITETNKDYLNVINTNINGYKTDGVIEQKVEHTAEIKSDGSVEVEIAVIRHHQGGNTNYEWWNKVNANYMRVYVPRGSKLLKAEGQVREFVAAPLDYDKLGFSRDPEVEKEEKGIIVDYKSGTRVYEDAGKTVFANWTYVSPGETTVIKYKYLLPFKIGESEAGCSPCVYSLLAQKQAGSLPSQFTSIVRFPRQYKVIWRHPDGISESVGEIRASFELRNDNFLGLVFVN